LFIHRHPIETSFEGRERPESEEREGEERR
jgi:hypothetical protein